MTSWLVTLELHTDEPAGGSGWHIGAAAPGPSQDMAIQAKAFGLASMALVRSRGFYGSAFDALVDRWVECDTGDAEAVLRALARQPVEVAAVTSLVDTFVPVAAKAARALGLPGPTPDSPALTRDKAAARAAMDRAGAPPVRWARCALADAPETSPIGYPAVVKPVDGAASWDVRLVRDDAEFAAALARHRNRGYPRGVTPKGVMVVEEHLVGPVHSAEGYVAATGEPVILGWSGRVMSPPPSFVELALTCGTRPPIAGADEFVRTTLAALGYDFGGFHLEFVLTDRGPRLLELNARMLGAGSHNCLTALSGVSPFRAVTANLAGWPPLSRPEAPPCEWAGVVAQAYLTAPRTGRLIRPPSPAAIADESGGRLVAARWWAGAGAPVRKPESSSDYLGWLMARGRDEDDALRAAAELGSALASSWLIEEAA